MNTGSKLKKKIEKLKRDIIGEIDVDQSNHIYNQSAKTNLKIFGFVFFVTIAIVILSF